VYYQQRFQHQKSHVNCCTADAQSQSLFKAVTQYILKTNALMTLQMTGVYPSQTMTDNLCLFYNQAYKLH